MSPRRARWPAERRRLGAGDRWQLDDERGVPARSLADAAAEHEAGDLCDADYEALAARDRARLAEVEAAAVALRSTSRPGPLGPGDAGRRAGPRRAAGRRGGGVPTGRRAPAPGLVARWSAPLALAAGAVCWWSS